MRVMSMYKEGSQGEAAAPPAAEAMAEYLKFDQELVKAGGVLESGRLHPSSLGKRVRVDGEKRTVIHGPLSESKELVAGYLLGHGRSPHAGPATRQRAPHARRGRPGRPRLP